MVVPTHKKPKETYVTLWKNGGKGPYPFQSSRSFSLPQGIFFNVFPRNGAELVSPRQPLSHKRPQLIENLLFDWQMVGTAPHTRLEGQSQAERL